MPFAAYLRRFLLTAAFGVLAAAGFSALIDPYSVTGAPDIAGLNAKKTESYRHARLAKEARARRLAPATVLIGNSRVDVGLDPESAYWPEDMRPAANLGIPGEGVEGSLASLRFALAEIGARTIVLGLDFTDFLALQRGAEPENQPPAPAAHLTRTLLSTTALADSILTIADQRRPFATAMTQAGFNPMADHDAIIAREGHFALAGKKNRDNLARLAARAPSARHPDGRPGAPLGTLEILLAEASDAGIRLIAYIHPFHAEFLQSIELSGRGPGYREWKLSVSALFARYARPGWRLWDFGVHAPETIEPFPPAGDRQVRLRFWWEPGHYKAALGEVLLARMLAGRSGFGAELRPDTIGPHLAEQERLARAFAKNHPQLRRYLRSLCPPDACRHAPMEPQLTLKM